MSPILFQPDEMVMMMKLFDYFGNQRTFYVE